MRNSKYQPDPMHNVNDIGRKPALNVGFVSPGHQRDYGSRSCSVCGKTFQRDTYNASKCLGCRKQAQSFLNPRPMRGA